MNTITEIDLRLFVLLNQKLTAPFLDVVMPFVTDFDNWRVPLVLILLVALARGTTELRLGILFAVLAVAASDQCVSSGIKPLVERARPFDVVAGTRKLVGAHDFSFPSGHAANTFAAATFLAMRFPRMLFLFVIPLIVSYSRVYVGVHYPLDVVAGGLIGILVGAFFVLVERTARLRFGRRSARGAPTQAESAATTSAGSRVVESESVEDRTRDS
jgi:undecaprenyl-diphosphatase